MTRVSMNHDVIHTAPLYREMSFLHRNRTSGLVVINQIGNPGNASQLSRPSLGATNHMRKSFIHGEGFRHTAKIYSFTTVTVIASMFVVVTLVASAVVAICWCKRNSVFTFRKSDRDEYDECEMDELDLEEFEEDEGSGCRYESDDSPGLDRDSGSSRYEDYVTTSGSTPNVTHVSPSESSYSNCTGNGRSLKRKPASHRDRPTDSTSLLRHSGSAGFSGSGTISDSRTELLLRHSKSSILRHNRKKTRSLRHSRTDLLRGSHQANHGKTGWRWLSRKSLGVSNSDLYGCSTNSVFNSADDISALRYTSCYLSNSDLAPSDPKEGEDRNLEDEVGKPTFPFVSFRTSGYSRLIVEAQLENSKNRLSVNELE